MLRGISPRSIVLASSLFLGVGAMFSAAFRINPVIAAPWILARAGDVPNATRASLAQTAGASFPLPNKQGAALPTLNSSVTPQAYGAKGDGVTDDTAAFQSALNAGDLLVKPATYLINGNIYVPSYRNVQCQPGATLHTTRHDGHESGVITF